METIQLNQGEHLFQIGEDDKWLYVIQEGQINLYIMEDSNEVNHPLVCNSDFEKVICCRCP